MDQTTSPGQPPDAPERSTGELVKLMSQQFSTLVRDELKLAQLEMTRKGKQAGISAGMFGGSGLIALYGLGKSRLQKATPPVPQEALHSVKTDVDEIKERTRR